MALALHTLEAEEKSHECPICGGDSRECQNPAYQRAYEAAFTRCYRTKTVGNAMKARQNDDASQALVASTRFHPDRVKQQN